MEIIENKLAWDSLLEEEFKNINDIYFSYNYHSLFQKHFHSRPQAIYWEDETIKVFHPRLVRPIKISNELMLSSQAVDLTSVYGYTGPLLKSNTSDDQKIHNSIAKFIDDYKTETISEFIRFHPLNIDPLLWKNAFNVQLSNDVVIIDLNKNKDEIWNNISKGQKYNIKKSYKEKISSEIIQDPTDADIVNFLEIYSSTMKRNNASTKYFFTKEFIKDHFKLLDIILLNIQLNNTLVSSNLFLLGNGILHYHLSGSNFDLKGIYPSSVAIWEVIQWAKGNNYKYFHLGGGRGQNDSLFNFKKSFSSKTVPFYFGKIIFDQAKYDQLVKKRSLNTEGKSFFPLYRSGMNETII